MSPALVSILARINALVAQLESFKADNQLDLLQGKHPRWGSQDFDSITYSLEALAVQAVNLPN